MDWYENASVGFVNDALEQADMYEPVEILNHYYLAQQFVKELKSQKMSRLLPD